ncbi:MAG: homoserine dehydrogenase, partial [Spirochaetes bacterium]
MPTVNIGVVGLGVVGSGVYQLLSEHQKDIENKSGVRINLRWACDLDGRKKDQLRIPDDIFTDSVDRVLDDDSVDLVVELIGGTDIAKEITLRAIERKKHVVTANKALIAHHGKSIFEAVVNNRVEFGFEASVGGGIPIIKTLLEGLVGNEINKIVGIVNGTTNFILTMMTKENIDFIRALKIAQEKGFAESDPTLDISGGDASHKITILASLAFKSWVELSGVFV